MHNNDIGNTLEFVWKWYKTSQIATNQKEVDFPYFIVVLVIIWGFPGLVWSFLGEKLRFIFFMFTERLELIKVN